MFVKTGWRIYKGKRYYNHHLAESYRENGKIRTRRLLNISVLPPHAIEALRHSLRTGKAAKADHQGAICHHCAGTGRLSQADR